MGSKKKLAQAARREARDAMKGYRESLKGKLGVFNQCIKPKPKWVSKKAWRWIMSFFVDIELIEKELLK